MPRVLVQAHQALDRAVDIVYGHRTFTSDAERVAFLFERYQQLTSFLPPDRTARKRHSPRVRRRFPSGEWSWRPPAVFIVVPGTG